MNLNTDIQLSFAVFICKIVLHFLLAFVCGLENAFVKIFVNLVFICGS